MAAPKGNQFAKGGKGGGRQSIKDERLRELVVSKALGKYVKALRDIGGNDSIGMNDKQFNRIKEMCLPVVLKDMATKLAGNKGQPLEELTTETKDKINNAIKEYIDDSKDTTIK